MKILTNCNAFLEISWLKLMFHGMGVLNDLQLDQRILLTTWKYFTKADL